MTSLCKLSSYSDMLSVLAASSVTMKAIQTLWPLAINPSEMLPFTKLVLGRGVATCRRPVQILWSITEYSGYPPHINHFVPQLLRTVAPETAINCDENVDLNMPHRPHDATLPADNDINPGVPVLHATPVSTEASHSTETTIGIPLPSPRNFSGSMC